MSKTCLEVALERLEKRAIRDSTYRTYLGTLKALEIEDLPIEEATVRALNKRLQMVPTASTRKKHAVSLSVMLGIKVPCAPGKPKVYDLPPVSDVHAAFEDSPYRVFAFSMLYAGMRIGESCVRQESSGNVIDIQRQRNPKSEITPAKTTGEVIVPDWFAEEYRSSEIPSLNHATVYTGIRRRALKMLGIRMNPHQLRHLFATRLVDIGAPPNVLQRQMRHSKIETALTFYVQTRPADIAKMMDRFADLTR